MGNSILILIDQFEVTVERHMEALQGVSQRVMQSAALARKEAKERLIAAIDEKLSMVELKKSDFRSEDQPRD